MIVELGHFALVLAFLVALAQTILPAWGARVGEVRLMRVGEAAALTQFFLLIIAFGALMHAYVVNALDLEPPVPSIFESKP